LLSITTFSPALGDETKYILFLSIRDDEPGSGDTTARYWSWRVFTNSTIAILGSNDPAITQME